MTTVKSCQQAKKADGSLKEWNGKPIYEVILSDGIKGESFSSIPAGTPDTDLTIEDGQYGKKIKLNKKNGFAGAVKPRVGNESFAMSYAKDLVVADKVKVEQLIPTADKIYEWLENKKK
jgi:hypothetical protein